MLVINVLYENDIECFALLCACVPSHFLNHDWLPQMLPFAMYVRVIHQLSEVIWA